MATIVALIAWFAALGIHTSQKDSEGKTRRTTGRVPGGLAWYATTPREGEKSVWVSKDGKNGGSKLLAVINHREVDTETGEVTQTREYVDVCFNKTVAIQKGDHVLAKGNWVPGKPFMRADGIPSAWNDTLFVTEYCVIPASVREGAMTNITVSEPTPVETEAVQSEQAALFVAEVQAGIPAAVESTALAQRLTEEALANAFEAANADKPAAPARRRK